MITSHSRNPARISSDAKEWARQMIGLGWSSAQRELIRKEIHSAMYWGPRDRDRVREMFRECVAAMQDLEAAQ
tara:strand:- start:739 stop:957 length:219 start_codon:yes stop_codon:yes gene_type:complete